MNNKQTPESPHRRKLLSCFGLGAVSILLPSPIRAQAKSLQNLSAEPIRQPSEGAPQAFIDRAFEMRQLAIDHGDQACGAVVVKGDVIIGQSWSRVVLDGDPTGHAEMSAIRDAARRGQASLSSALLYSTSIPCSMCQGAAAWVGIAGMRYGRSGTDGGQPNSCG